MLPFFLSLFIRAGLIYYSWLHRDVPAARTFGWLSWAGNWWTFFYILHLADPTLEGKLQWQTISYFGAVATPALWLIFSLEITGHRNWLTPRVRAAIWFWAIIIMLLCLTNDWHHLFWEHYELDDYRLEWKVTHGPLFQLLQLPTFVIFFFNLAIYARYFFTCPRFYRPQALFLGIAGLFPVGGRIIQVVFGFVFVDRVDQVPLFLGISAIFYAIAVFRFNALDVISFAQRLVIDNIRAAVIVIDHQQRILGINPYASQRWPHAEPVGAPLTEVMPEYSDRHLIDGDEWEMEHLYEGENHWYLIKVSAITDRHEDTLGFALILLDISAQKKVEQTLQESQAAVALEKQQLLAKYKELLDSIEKAKETGKQSVFISHASENREFIEQQIIPPLEKAGIGYWYSKEDIQTASEWERSILNGLEHCEWFFIAMSPESLRSEWVKDELFWAIDNRPDRILPVVIAACDPVEFHIRMRRLQVIDFTDNTADSQEMMITAITST